MGMVFRAPLEAIRRARFAILTMAGIHIVSLIAGLVMAHSGNGLALAYRDELVAGARRDDPAALALRRNERLTAALIDAGRNALLGAVPTTFAGISVVGPYPIAAFRGWVGGVVSVRGDHTSRLSEPREAVYYLVTVTLQVIPYTLCVGAGVNLGLSYFRPCPFYEGRKWLGFPREAILDVLRVYLLAAPVFLVASLWEYLAR
jgi:hypothetical protein